MKAVQSYYMEFGTYPRGAYSISEYVSVNACRVPDPSRCKNMTTYTPSGNSWFTPSGFYQIFFRGGYGYRTQILAAPTGSFASTGLPVVGCFNSQTNIMEIKLLTIKNISTSQMFCWYKYYPSKFLVGKVLVGIRGTHDGFTSLNVTLRFLF